MVTLCVCAFAVYASVLFPYGYVFFPPFVVLHNAIDLAVFHLLSLVKIIFE